MKVPNDRENELRKPIAPSIVSTCIVNLCSSIPLSFQEETELLALDALVCCHHPSVYPTNKNLWVKITKKLKFSPETLISRHIVQLKKTYIDEYKNLKVGFTDTKILLILLRLWITFAFSGERERFEDNRASESPLTPTGYRGKNHKQLE